MKQNIFLCLIASVAIFTQVSASDKKKLSLQQLIASKTENIFSELDTLDDDYENNANKDFQPNIALINQLEELSKKDNQSLSNTSTQKQNQECEISHSGSQKLTNTSFIIETNQAIANLKLSLTQKDKQLNENMPSPDGIENYAFSPEKPKDKERLPIRKESKSPYRRRPQPLNK